MLLVLYGLPGCGKTFVGQCLQQHCSFHFYDADKDLSPGEGATTCVHHPHTHTHKHYSNNTDMVAALKAGKTFTPEMRLAYFETVVANIRLLRQTHARLGVCVRIVLDSHTSPQTQHSMSTSLSHIHTPQL